MATNDPTFAPALSAVLSSSPVAVTGSSGTINPASIAGFPSNQNTYLAGDGQWRFTPGKAIADFTVSTATASVDFQNLVQTFSNLTLVTFVKGSTTLNVGVRFNNDSATNYRWEQLLASSTTVSAATNVTQSSIVVSATVSTNVAVSQSFVPNYTSALAKEVISNSYRGDGASLSVFGGDWTGTAAINRITFVASTGTFAVGSRFTVLAS